MVSSMRTKVLVAAVSAGAVVALAGTAQAAAPAAATGSATVAAQEAPNPPGPVTGVSVVDPSQALSPQLWSGGTLSPQVGDDPNTGVVSMKSSGHRVFTLTCPADRPQLVPAATYRWHTGSAATVGIEATGGAGNASDPGWTRFDAHSTNAISGGHHGYAAIYCK